MMTRTPSAGFCSPSCSSRRCSVDKILRQLFQQRSPENRFSILWSHMVASIGWPIQATEVENDQFLKRKLHFVIQNIGVFRLYSLIFFFFTLPFEIYDFCIKPPRGLSNSCPTEYPSNILPQIQFSGIFRRNIPPGSYSVTGQPPGGLSEKKIKNKKLMGKI